MKTRIITAIVGILVLIGVLFTFDTLVFNFVIAAITLIAIHEVFKALGFGRKEWPMYAVFVPLLVQAGVTSFHVTLANHSALENTIPPASHPEFKETGCFLKFCDEVRRYTSVPLCGVGGLNDPDFVEQQLASGRIQCAAMCRQLLADPNWVNKLQSGNAAKIHRCVRCNKKCLGGLIAHQGTRCIYDALNAKEQGSI